MFHEVLVLGAGSAGLIAALTLKRIMPQLSIRIVRSPEIGVIGVGESTTPIIPFHMFQYLGIPQRRFYALAEPTWKMGIHFIWGPRGSFEYAFEQQLDVRVLELPRPNGFYCDDDFSNMCLQSALMAQNKAFTAQSSGGGPEIPSWHALLGKTLEEPYISFSSSLFNDRAMVGGWPREPDELIEPYTTAETMDCGWCWRIEHETEINRGYVYCSSAISDDAAREEFQRKNPKIQIRDRVVKFRSGRYQRAWVDNVMAVGNSCGFVEPLESSALMVICWQCQTFCELVSYVGTTPKTKELFNRVWAATWDELRDFLSIHYRFNTLLDTPYWKHCQNDADISRLTPLLEFYEENGPTGHSRYYLNNTGSQFGIEGFLVMLVGNRVPYRNRHNAAEWERQIINQRRAQFQTQASQGLDVRQGLAFIRHPQWRWLGET